MSKQNIKKTTPPLEQRVTNIERTLESIAAQNQDVTPQKLDAKFESAQEAHESALASHRTKVERGIRQSLNSATTPAEAEALLKQLEQKQRKKD
jgi:hypothetical protein